MTNEAPDTRPVLTSQMFWKNLAFCVIPVLLCVLVLFVLPWSMIGHALKFAVNGVAAGLGLVFGKMAVNWQISVGSLLVFLVSAVCISFKLDRYQPSPTTALLSNTIVTAMVVGILVLFGLMGACASYYGENADMRDQAPEIVAVSRRVEDSLTMGALTFSDAFDEVNRTRYGRRLTLVSEKNRIWQVSIDLNRLACQRYFNNLQTQTPKGHHLVSLNGQAPALSKTPDCPNAFENVLVFENTRQ
jgi:hypothetical protein